MGGFLSSQRNKSYSRGCKPSPVMPEEEDETPSNGHHPSDLAEAVQLQHQDFEKATKKFSEKNLIGSGPTGIVYNGILDGRPVAVKKLVSNSQIESDFMREVELMKQLRHENVVQLLAFCPEAGHRALALELAPLGSLNDVLHGKKGVPPAVSLRWRDRLNIMLGVAQGLEFLHKQRPGEKEVVVHNRIKPQNILVFDGFVGKITDCALQPQSADSIVCGDSELPLGNFAYDAPEWINMEVTEKSDVYAFGVLMLEVLTGRKAMSSGNLKGPSGRPEQMKQWALGHIQAANFREVVDPNIVPDDLPDKVLKKYCDLATVCLNATSSMRPRMKDVAKYLRVKCLQD